MHSVVAIGVFDGLHLGHQALTDRTAQVAVEAGLSPVALTFHPHPMSVLRGASIAALTSINRRVELLRSAGMAQVSVAEFTKELASQSPEEFITQRLIGQLNAEQVVVGEGFRFGQGARGTIDDLSTAGLIVHEVGQVTYHRERVSSTRIREAVAIGEVSLAAELLTRPHRYEGLVVKGHQRGRELGFPTANLQPDFAQAVPADGVYAGYLIDLGSDGVEVGRWPAAVSVGTNPTFDDVPVRVVEAHALTAEDLDLYGRHMAVDFVERQRPMLAFASIDELIRAMQEDVVRCAQILGLR